MKDAELDVLITASSRPQLLKPTVEYFHKFIHFEGKMRWILHEDFVYKEQSKETIKWAKESGYFDEIYEDDPPLGLGVSIEEMLKKINTKFMFYLQDDWVFERPVDLDRIVYTMERDDKINCIHFNKYRNMPMVDGFKQKEMTLTDAGLRVCIFHSWSLLPGVWRTDFVRDRWIEPRTNRPVAWFTWQLGSGIKRRGKMIKNFEARLNNRKSDIYKETKGKWENVPSDEEVYKYLQENVGVYLYGHLGDPRYIRHIGEDLRMEHWRRKDGKPGIEGASQERNAGRYMAPWLTFERIPKELNVDEYEERKE